MRMTILSNVGLAAILLVSAGAASGQTQMGTVFTYQGQLTKDGSTVTDTCDFEFSLWDATSDGNQKASTLTIDAVEVGDGLFTVNLDFGQAFNGEARWLEMAVCCPSSCTVETLDPRQELTPAPYSLRASNGVGGAQRPGDRPGLGKGRHRDQHSDHGASYRRISASGRYEPGHHLGHRRVPADRRIQRHNVHRALTRWRKR